MRTYQLQSTTAEYNPNCTFKILITHATDVMNASDFIKYIECNIAKDRFPMSYINDFKKVNPEYLLTLPIGKHMLAPNWDILVSQVPAKVRLYSLDNCNDLFPLEYNVSQLDQFISVLTTFYTELTSSHPVNVKLADIANDTYLESLPVGHNTIQYNHVFSSGTQSDFHWFNIIVSEFLV